MKVHPMWCKPQTKLHKYIRKGLWLNDCPGPLWNGWFLHLSSLLLAPDATLSLTEPKSWVETLDAIIWYSTVCCCASGRGSSSGPWIGSPRLQCTGEWWRPYTKRCTLLSYFRKEANDIYTTLCRSCRGWGQMYRDDVARNLIRGTAVSTALKGCCV